MKVAALHGTRLPDDCLWWGADYIMNTLAPEDLVLALKRTTGGITYATDVETPQGVVVETGRPIECLRTLLSSGRYPWGTSCASGTAPTPGACRKRRWSGRTGSCGTTRRGRPGWTPPTRRCCNTSPRWWKECGELGFKEVLLDQFCYPADTTGVANTAADPVQVLADFAENLRSALPEGHSPVGGSAKHGQSVRGADG